MQLSGASGNAGVGAPQNLPLLFSQHHHHDIDNPLSVPLALARAGGDGGPVFIYTEDGLNSSCTTFAGGGRRWF